MNSLPIIERRLMDDLYFNEEKMLSYHVAYPSVALLTHTAFEINNYLEYLDRNYVQHLRNTLYTQAIHHYLSCKNVGKEFIPFLVNREYLVTLASGLLSLYKNTIEYSGDMQCTQLQTSVTFDAKNGNVLSLDSFFAEDCEYDKLIITYIIFAIAQQLDQGATHYYDDCLQLAASSFNEDNFYLLTNAMAFYYQQDTIAQPSAGICTFVVPFESIEEYLRDN